MQQKVQSQAFGAEPDEDALLHKQLGYYGAWLSSLAQAPMQAVTLSTVQSALRVVVSGFQDTSTAEELQTAFEGFMAANGAAVAPGRAVVSCRIQGGSPLTALLQLRCSVEASNCLAFNKMPWNGTVLKVERPADYCHQAAVLLGPTEANPAVLAAVAHSTAAVVAADGDAGRAAGSAACASNGNGSSFAAAVRSCAVPAAVAAAHGGRPSASTAAGGGAGPTAPGPYLASVPGGAGASAADGSAASKGGARDLLLPADQSKQDEVFIGGLPSHWKAQQLKELLAPYGQLKSLSVAMDAATGKNKGYAFVVFASPDMVSHAIEELDCRVVEGKILAVQRATEGKASYGRDSSAGGNDTGSLRDGGFVGPSHQAREGPAALQQPQQPPPHQPQLQPPPIQQHPLQLRHHHHHRSSSTGSALPPHLPPPLVADAAVVPAAGNAAAGGFGGHSRGNGAGAAAAVPSMGPAPPSAADSGMLGPRPPAAAGPGGAAGSSMQHQSGPSSAKQYDINELYIGDLPLTWDEDAVRRLLGRFGRIKYFTLRNGRDKNFAFCKFKDSSVVDAAIAGLHGKIVDGYFLNVRRAIEGKQQASATGPPSQTQQPWLAGKQPPLPQHHQQQQNVRASFDATSSRVTAAAHRPRMSADQQQLSKLAAAATAAGPPPFGPGSGAGGKAGGFAGPPFGPHAQRGNVMAAGGAAGHQQERLPAGGKSEQPQKGKPASDAVREQQLLREQERARAGSPACAPAGAAAAQQQQQEAASADSTAPSTPGTPTNEQQAAAAAAVAAQNQLQHQAGAAPSAAVGAVPAATAGLVVPQLGSYAPFMGPQLLQRPALQPPLHQQLPLQQQLQQQAQQMYQAQPGYTSALPLFPGPLPPPAHPGGAASLFGPNGPASWPGTASIAAAAAAAAAVAASPAAGNLSLGGAAGGGFGLGLDLKQQQPQQQAAQEATQQHLLQTPWDMLAPWSLFSQSPLQ